MAMLPRMKTTVALLVTLGVAGILMNGCGKSSSPIDSVAKLYKPTPDKDVTEDSKYNFSSFAGTVWKTKVKVAIAEGKRYTGTSEIRLLVPKRFDPTHPRYTPAENSKIISVLPVGTILRIGKLLEDQGAWGGVEVTATLEDGTNGQKTVFLDAWLLGDIKYIQHGPTSSTNWSVDPEMLEEVKSKSASTL